MLAVEKKKHMFRQLTFQWIWIFILHCLTPLDQTQPTGWLLSENITLQLPIACCILFVQSYFRKMSELVTNFYVGRFSRDLWLPALQWYTGFLLLHCWVHCRPILMSQTPSVSWVWPSSNAVQRNTDWLKRGFNWLPGSSLSAIFVSIILLGVLFTAISYLGHEHTVHSFKSVEIWASLTTVYYYALWWQFGICLAMLLQMHMNVHIDISPS